MAARGAGRREDDPESAIARQLAFWTEALQGLPDQLDLPIDRPRPAVSSYRGDSVPLTLGPELHRGLLALARESGASLFMVLQAGLAALLTRLGAGTDIPIGSPIAGRTDSALDDLVGFFVNTLVLRTDTSGNPSFRELIARVRATNLAAYSHQDVPFERLVEVLNPARSLSRHPLFQVMLALQNNAPVRLELPGLRSAFEPVATASAKFDLSLEPRRAARRGRRAGGDRRALLEYATDLFDRASVEALAARLVRLLEAAVAEPERAIGSLDILAAEERRTILRDWNDTARAVPSATLPELFAAQVDDDARRDRGGVRGRAASPMVSSMRAPTSWRITCARSGVGPEVVVGLCVERSLEMVVGLLGILKAGGAYLPLDPGLPARAARLHAGGCRRAGAGHAVGAARSAAAARRTRSCGSMPTGPPSRAARQRTGSLPATRNTPPTSSTPPAPPEPRRASPSRMRGIPNLGRSADRALRHRSRGTRPAVRSAQLRCRGLGDLAQRCCSGAAFDADRCGRAQRRCVGRAHPRARSHACDICRRCCWRICRRTCRCRR